MKCWLIDLGTISFPIHGTNLSQSLPNRPRFEPSMIGLNLKHFFHTCLKLLHNTVYTGRQAFQSIKACCFFFFRPVDKYVASHRYVWSGSDFLMVHGKEGITEVNACVIHHSHMYFFFLTEMPRAIVVRRIGVIGLSCVYIRMLFNIFIFFLFFLSSLVG